MKELKDLKDYRKLRLYEIYHNGINKGLHLSTTELNITIDLINKSDCSIDINVNCPYCDEWQSVDVIDYEGESEYAKTHTCERCGVPFHVKATH